MKEKKIFRPKIAQRYGFGSRVAEMGSSQERVRIRHQFNGGKSELGEEVCLLMVCPKTTSFTNFKAASTMAASDAQQTRIIRYN